VKKAFFRAIITELPLDLSKSRQDMTQVLLLDSTHGRGALYHLHGKALTIPNLVSCLVPLISALSPNLAENRDTKGCLILDQRPLHVGDDVEPLSEGLCSRLERMTAEPLSPGLGRSSDVHLCGAATFRRVVRYAGLPGKVRIRSDSLMGHRVMAESAVSISVQKKTL
jgi:hypothetical protein